GPDGTQGSALASTNIGKADSFQRRSNVLGSSSGKSVAASPGPATMVEHFSGRKPPRRQGWTIAACNWLATGTNTFSAVTIETNPGCARKAPRPQRIAAPW